MYFLQPVSCKQNPELELNNYDSEYKSRLMNIIFLSIVTYLKNNSKKSHYQF